MITEYIPRGHDNRVTREELMRRTGMTDRRIRDEIQYENEYGEELIINVDDAYFLVDGKEDIYYADAYIAREWSRANTIAKKIRAMQAKRNDCTDEQLTLRDFGVIG